jgi:carboxyl-terminal processing protease
MPWYVGRRSATSVICSLVAGAAAALAVHGPPLLPIKAQKGLALWAERARTAGDEEIDGQSCDQNALDRGLLLPSGEPTALGCDDARIVVQQALSSIAAPVANVEPAKFADATADWLDPQGLWSAARDAPAGPLVRKNGERLLAELQLAPGAGPCAAALEIGAELVSWSKELRRIFDQAATSEGQARSLAEAFKLASQTPFEDRVLTHGARELARALGHDVGALRAAYGEAATPYAEAARSRAAPALDAEAWSRVVIAAALRAYIPQLDAHGAWAPLDEEISIYDLSLEAAPPERLWTEMTRTAIGVRIDRGALAPLGDGDVVLKVQDVPLAGVSVEQAEQLSVIPDARTGTRTRVSVLRAHEPRPLEFLVLPPSGVGVGVPIEPSSSELAVDLVRYGDGHAAVIPITDVPDDLGARLSRALDRARAARDVRGVVLDLRANGGGSTDGAIDALGLFMPGVSLFPMRRRDGEIEVERAPDVAAEKRWGGPVAVLVDGDSASAAEMIAGALQSYRRAVVVGDRTYGKGCAQEYLDDDAHTGVLRLTTLLFSLPDGAPVQKVGIEPYLRLSLPAVTEREALLTRAIGPWRGPDVRDRARVKDVPWPTHAGRVGPCRDPLLCRALRALGASPAAAR